MRNYYLVHKRRPSGPQVARRTRVCVDEAVNV